MSIFIMTGVAIVVYLNSPPAEPRERDYVYAGSFYAFAIWIGFGVLAIYEAIKRWFKKENVATAAIATVICASVPTILAAQNWDDHDRSGRYTARDFGYNYLTGLLPQAIIMNFGDNDTFPLWYIQEVENYRKDVRVMNMSYLGGEWYIDQMRVKSNDSEPVPFSLPRKKYTYNNDFLVVRDLIKEPVPIQDAIEFIKSDAPQTKVTIGGKECDFLPAKQLILPVNKENVLKSGIVKPEDADLIEDSIILNISSSSLTRDEMMALDLLANFDWKRPLYLTSASGLESLGLRDYLQLDGFSYRIVPIKTTPKVSWEVGRIDSDFLYDQLMNKYKYANIKDPKVYADYFVQNTFGTVQSRNIFARLAKQLLAEGDTTRAIEVLDRAIEEMPFNQIRHSYIQTIPLIEAYYMAGAYDKGNAILDDYTKILREYIDYYFRFKGKQATLVQNQLRNNISLLYELYTLALQYHQTDEASTIQQYFVGKGLMDA